MMHLIQLRPMSVHGESSNGRRRFLHGSLKQFDGTDAWFALDFSSWATYNLLAGCTVCQNSTRYATYVTQCILRSPFSTFGFISWGTWQYSCGTFISDTTWVLIVNYTKPVLTLVSPTNSYFPSDKNFTLPSQTAIPFWAATNRISLHFSGCQNRLTMKLQPSNGTTLHLTRHKLRLFKAKVRRIVQWLKIADWYQTDRTRGFDWCIAFHGGLKEIQHRRNSWWCHRWSCCYRFGHCCHYPGSQKTEAPPADNLSRWPARISTFALDDWFFTEPSESQCHVIGNVTIPRKCHVPFDAKSAVSWVISTTCHFTRPTNAWTWSRSCRRNRNSCTCVITDSRPRAFYKRPDAEWCSSTYLIRISFDTQVFPASISISSRKRDFTLRIEPNITSTC